MRLCLALFMVIVKEGCACRDILLPLIQFISKRTDKTYRQCRQRQTTPRHQRHLCQRRPWECQQARQHGIQGFRTSPVPQSQTETSSSSVGASVAVYYWFSAPVLDCWALLQHSVPRLAPQMARQPRRRRLRFRSRLLQLPLPLIPMRVPPHIYPLSRATAVCWAMILPKSEPIVTVTRV